MYEEVSADPCMNGTQDTEIELFSLAGNDGQLREINESFAQLLGIPLDEINGKSLLELVHPDDIGNIVAGIAELEAGATEVLFESRFMQTSGRCAYLQWVARPLPNTDLWWAAGRDTTEFHRLLSETNDLKARLDLALSHATAAMWEINMKMKTISWEPVASEVIGVDASALPDSLPGLLTLFASAEAESIAKAFNDLKVHHVMEVATKRGEAGQVKHLSFRGKVLDFDRRGRPARAVGLAVDITAEKAMEEQMLRMIMSDGLTGIPNRRAFDQSLRSEWRRCKRDSISLTLMMIDIDNFKRFNDTFGHLVGDDALCAIARALGNEIRGEDQLVARFGGEEFAIVLPGVKAIEAQNITERLLSAVRKVNVRQAPDWNFSVSIGHSSSMNYSSDLKSSDLLGQADEALYRAKSGGKDRAVAFESSLERVS